MTQKIGALILHGFTSTTAAVAPVEQAVAAAGFETQTPLLPGHGTSWQDLAQTSAQQIKTAVAEAAMRLAARCDTVVPVGFSMGGALALWWAGQSQAPAAVLINPGLRLGLKERFAGRFLGGLIPTVPAVAGDIAAPGVEEEAYERTPVKAVGQLDKIFASARAELPQLTARVLLLRSERDAVVGQASWQLLKRELPAEQVQEVILRRSQHVATLDYDAELLQRRTVQFLQELVSDTAPTDARN